VTSSAYVAVSVLLAVAMLVGCGGDDVAERDDDGRVIHAGDLDVVDLRVGDCFVPPDDVEAEISSVRAVPCEEPHQHEVYAFAPWTEGDLRPDDNQLGTFADTACLAEFEPYVGRDYLDSPLVLTYLLPSIRSWNELGDHGVVCVARSNGELSSSVWKGTPS
jgi:hypothetical protein